MRSTKCAPAWSAASASKVSMKCRSVMPLNVTPPKRSPRRRFDIQKVDMSLRLQRVRELLKREIGEVIRREIPVGDAGLITVNDVTVTSDLQLATVYIGILGNADQQKKGLAQLHEHRKRIQGLVGKAVVLKYT